MKKIGITLATFVMVLTLAGCSKSYAGVKVTSNQYNQLTKLTKTIKRMNESLPRVSAVDIKTVKTYKTKTTSTANFNRSIRELKNENADTDTQNAALGFVANAGIEKILYSNKTMHTSDMKNSNKVVKHVLKEAGVTN
ncbi:MULTISPECIES: hypothetical protein [Lactiplantibacillus]|uniref:hypothetical protein n=1 Tax=Lactiplantibacillus TaxID=2767842 RepID=UPI000704A76F|nr:MULTISPECIES: hypothetical protein [Lactiplantibacillus]AYJ42488.1 hypothetical protein LP314_11705 [Lactiplantibacillus pentosus]MBU7503425.1 hypothetical protein [Lactiplantibacillus pentosus]MCT3312002.1 hypothetical protein [Lactiplantibacillus pentosus]MDY1544153.1 hypothetical protein [Lactiplantibacillus pentosus]PKX55402.1 hypothetical protein BIS22_10245 [Lactiplantibacillus pentosus]